MVAIPIPQSGLGFVQNLENHLAKSNGTIASLIGRYYTMDRDKRWERVKVGYDLLVSGVGKPVKSIINAMEESYAEGVTDEFIKPIVKVDQNWISPLDLIAEGDVVICFNFRTDRLARDFHSPYPKGYARAWHANHALALCYPYPLRRHL
jgi:2,3-bisphosphoglycerate-independent phosphoglycerate mutase